MVISPLHEPWKNQGVPSRVKAEAPFSNHNVIYHLEFFQEGKRDERLMVFPTEFSHWLPRSHKSQSWLQHRSWFNCSLQEEGVFKVFHWSKNPFRDRSPSTLNDQSILHVKWNKPAIKCHLSVENKQVYFTAIQRSFTEFRVIHSNEDKTPFTS